MLERVEGAVRQPPDIDKNQSLSAAPRGRHASVSKLWGTLRRASMTKYSSMITRRGVLVGITASGLTGCSHPNRLSAFSRPLDRPNEVYGIRNARFSPADRRALTDEGQRA